MLSTIDAATKIYGIIGNPVKHSFSPRLHSNAFQQIDYNAVYLPFSIKEDDIQSILKMAEKFSIAGFNVTVPYKNKILDQLDRVSHHASMIDSVNTVFYQDGLWHGDSTDGIGFIRSLEGFIEKTACQSVQVAGAGGSAKAICFALIDFGIEKLRIINRTKENAVALVAQIKQHYPDCNVDVGHFQNEYDLLINTTSLGLTSNDLPVSTELINLAQAVIDIIYNPKKTAFLQEAERQEKPIKNGLDMLLYQAAESFQIWTKHPAPIENMRATLLELTT